MKTLRISAVLLGSLLLLAGCVAPDGVVRVPYIGAGTVPQADQKPTKPLACLEFDKIHYSAGKPGVTVDDVRKALDLPPEGNPLGHARNLLGDTRTTQAQAQDHNDVYERLCSQTPATP